MPRDWRLRVDDMLSAIANIESFIGDDDFTSAKSRLALERAFEILSEASRHVPRDVKDRYAIRWQALADLGNVIRHGYDRVSIERLVDTARDDLGPLKRVLLDIKGR